MAQDDGGKADGAMLAIGELADRIGVPSHVLRYWETRFPELKPLQRSGKRRYYRAEDVALAEKIHDLLHVKGYTVEGARKALSGQEELAPVVATAEGADSGKPGVSVEELVALRQRLAAAIGVLI